MTIKNIIFKALTTIVVLTAFTNISKATDYYWIGGGGNWSEIGHWSLTSGNSGGVLAPQVPTALDNVIFDDNSGFGTTTASRTITFNAVAYANNFNVITTASANAPIFANGGHNENIPYLKGDFLLSPGTVWNVRHVSFGTTDASENVSIQTNGVTLNGNIIFADAGIKSLAGPLNSTQGVLSATGTINTNNHNLYLGQYFWSTSNFTLNLGASEVNVSLFSAQNATITSTNSIIVRSTASTPLAFHVANNSTFNKVRLMAGGIVRTTGSTFAELTLENNATIEGSNNINTLKLADAKQFTFVGGQTTTIGTLLANTPDCSGLMEMLSSTATQATLSIAAGTVHVPNVRMTGIKATGGATFTAVGVDNGNNTGWNFTVPLPKTIYWVGTGGDGNWNNNANWSAATSGAGGYCIPTQFDNVIFNSGSNVSVPINITGAQGYCKSITINGVTGTPNFNSGVLNIYGSSVWQAGMIYNLTTTYRGDGLTHTLTNNGVTFLQDVNFDNPLGGWTLQDALILPITSRDIYFSSGMLNTNSQNVIGRQFSHLSGTLSSRLITRQLILGSSQINVNRWVYDAGGTLNAGTSHITVTMNSLGGTYYAGFHGLSGHVYNNVTFTEAASSSIAFNNTFNTVNITGNHNFYGNGSTYRILNLTGGKNYTFLSNTTTTINEQLNYNTANCTGFPLLVTSNSGSRATISMPGSAGAVHIPNVRVRDIAVTGGATFTATGVNLGNNLGWTSITEDTTPKTLYWIGGEGEWTDATHWTTNSNGTPSGTGCVPTRFDNVVFNEFSGGSVSFKVTNTSTVNSECHDMTWTNGVPANTRFEGNTVEISGSLRIAPGMIWSPSNVVFRSNDMGETIETNGVYISSANSGNGTFQFAGSGGYTLVDNLRTVSRILLYSGSLNTNGKEITATTFNFEVNGQSSLTTAILNISNSIIRVINWSFNNTAINTTNSHIYANGRFHSANGVVYNNVTGFGQFFSSNTFNEVVLNGTTTMNGSNTFKKLTLLANQLTLNLTDGTTQTVQEELFINGTPCANSIVRALSTVANLNVLAGTKNFDFVNVSGINASGLPLVFDRNSVNIGNNSNITFNTGTGGLVGLGSDLTCHEIIAGVPSSYTLSAAGFYGGITTTYSWTKVGDPAHPGVLGNQSTLDISTLGYGTYKVVVDYGGASVCNVDDFIVVSPKTVLPIAVGNQKICATVHTSLANLTITGTDIKWYADAVSTTVLPSTTLLVNGTYYATQTVSGCESKRIPVTVRLENCAIANPTIKSRVGN